MPYLAMDGHGLATLEALAAAGGSHGTNVIADLKLAKELANGAIRKLDYGASVEMDLDPPGPHGTHVRVLTGRNAGLTGLGLEPHARSPLESWAAGFIPSLSTTTHADVDSALK